MSAPSEDNSQGWVEKVFSTFGEEITARHGIEHATAIVAKARECVSEIMERASHADLHDVVVGIVSYAKHINAHQGAPVPVIHASIQQARDNLALNYVS